MFRCNREKLSQINLIISRLYNSSILYQGAYVQHKKSPSVLQTSPRLVPSAKMPSSWSTDSIERYGRAPLGYYKYDAQVLKSWTLLPKNAFMLLECPFCRFHHTRSTICKCQKRKEDNKRNSGTVRQDEDFRGVLKVVQLPRCASREVRWQERLDQAHSQYKTQRHTQDNSLQDRWIKPLALLRTPYTTGIIEDNLLKSPAYCYGDFGSPRQTFEKPYSHLYNRQWLHQWPRVQKQHLRLRIAAGRSFSTCEIDIWLQSKVSAQPMRDRIYLRLGQTLRHCCLTRCWRQERWQNLINIQILVCGWVGAEGPVPVQCDPVVATAAL